MWLIQLTENALLSDLRYICRSVDVRVLRDNEFRWI